MKLEHFLIPYRKINSKWIKDLNVRLETIKLQKENIGRTLFDIIMATLVFDLSPATEGIKAKISQWDPAKLKNSCPAKETANKTKRQPTGWEKTFANDK